MTPDEIDALPAGPELDWLVAEKVMGWTQDGDFWKDSAGVVRANLDEREGFTPSTSDAAALEILAKLKGEGRPIDIATSSGEWSVYVGAQPGKTELTAGMARSPSLALAICRAALRLVQR